MLPAVVRAPAVLDRESAMTLRLVATKRRRLAAAAVFVLAAFGAAGLARAATTPANCKGCFAMVRANGSLVYYRGLTANYKPAVGQYAIDFKYPINKCALTATIDSLEVEKEIDEAYILLRVSTPHRLPIFIGDGVADGVNGWRCGASVVGLRGTSRTASCAASSATAARRAG